MSSFVFRSFIFLVILLVSPIFVASALAAHLAYQDIPRNEKAWSCKFTKDSRNKDASFYNIEAFAWCTINHKPPNRCYDLVMGAAHYYIGRCVAGLPNPPWSKIYADVRQKYLNEISKRVPQRRKAARSYIPLNSKRTIRSIQSRLSKLGYRPGPVDGKMGRRTRAAIKSYQRRHRLSVTGRPNRQLLAALKITSSARPSSSSRARANPPRSSRRSSSAGRTKRRTATSSAIDASFATKCLRADRTNSYFNSCRYAVTERTIAKAPGGWHVMVGQTIKPGRRGGLLVASYKGRYHYMGCRTSDVRSNQNNRCVQVWFCLHKLYKQRVMMRSAGSLLGRCGVSLAVTKGR